jgi:hypothetical protein
MPLLLLSLEAQAWRRGRAASRIVVPAGTTTDRLSITTEYWSNTDSAIIST